MSDEEKGWALNQAVQLKAIPSNHRKHTAAALLKARAVEAKWIAQELERHKESPGTWIHERARSLFRMAQEVRDGK